MMDSNDIPVPEVKLKVEDIKIKTEVDDNEQGLDNFNLPYEELNIKEESFEFLKEEANSNFIKEEPKDEELKNENSNVVKEKQEDYKETNTLREDSENSQSDTKKQFKCDDCGKQFTRKQYLTIHKRMHFDEAKCKDVSIRINSSNEVKNSVLRWFACDKCQKVFLKSWYLISHQRTHSGERPFHCDRCDKQFTKRYDLNRHVRSVHKVDPQFVECPECDKKFSRRDRFLTHMKRHKSGAVKKRQPKDKTITVKDIEETQNRWDNIKTYIKKPSTVRTYRKCEALIKQEKVESDWMEGSRDGSNGYACTRDFSLDMLKQGNNAGTKTWEVE